MGIWWHLWVHAAVFVLALGSIERETMCQVWDVSSIVSWKKGVL
jgi:hypothetical protein